MTETLQVPDFVTTCLVRADPAAVHDAVGTAAGVSGWWFPTTEPAAGRLRVHMGDRGVDLAVERAGDTTTWEVLDCPVEPAWNGTHVVFRTHPTDLATVLRFTHERLAGLPCAEVCFAGWSHYLPSLVALVESGTGTPGPRRH